MAGFGCFVFSLSTTVVCLFAFLVMVRRQFYVHHTHVTGLEDSRETREEAVEDEDEDQELDRKDWSSPPWTLILTKCWMPAATIFCVAVVTNVRTKGFFSQLWEIQVPPLFCRWCTPAPPPWSSRPTQFMDHSGTRSTSRRSPGAYAEFLHC